MHYHHSGQIFRTERALDDYCDRTGADIKTVRFCVADRDCLEPPVRQEASQDTEPTPD